MNLIRLVTVASLLESGEAFLLDADAQRPDLVWSSGRLSVVEVGMQGRFDTVSTETCMDRTLLLGSHAGVRAVIVALKRGNACGAKDGRKADW